MTKEEEDVWTLDVIYQSDLHGFDSMDDSVGFIPNGDDFKISFWGRSADSEVNMVGDVFRIPLPVSEVSEYFETKPEFQFYPYFFSTEGNIVILEIDSEVESIGTRKIVVYMPPGFSENTRPGNYYITLILYNIKILIAPIEIILRTPTIEKSAIKQTLLAVFTFFNLDTCIGPICVRYTVVVFKIFVGLVPVYDVFYMIDFFPGFIDFFKPALDQVSI